MYSKFLKGKRENPDYILTANGLVVVIGRNIILAFSLVFSLTKKGL